MLKKFLIAVAALSPTLALAHHHHHWHGHGHWFAPEIDGGATILGLAILGGMLAFMKKKA